jgi:hypothetical protein
VGRKKGESEEKGEEKVPGARGKRGQNYLIDAELWLTFALCPRPLRPIDNGLIYHSPLAVASQALLSRRSKRNAARVLPAATSANLPP